MFLDIYRVLEGIGVTILMFTVVRKDSKKIELQVQCSVRKRLIPIRFELNT